MQQSCVGLCHPIKCLLLSCPTDLVLPFQKVCLWREQPGGTLNVRKLHNVCSSTNHRSADQYFVADVWHHHLSTLKVSDLLIFRCFVSDALFAHHVRMVFFPSSKRYLSAATTGHISQVQTPSQTTHGFLKNMESWCIWCPFARTMRTIGVIERVFKSSRTR